MLLSQSLARVYPNIYTYTMLPEYSFDLLACTNRHSYDDYGYGPMVNSPSLDVAPFEMRATHQYAIDEIFLGKFLHYSHRVFNITDAQYVYVPFLIYELESIYEKTRAPCGHSPSMRLHTYKNGRRHVEKYILPAFVHKLEQAADITKDKTVILTMARDPMTYMKSFFKIGFQKSIVVFGIGIAPRQRNSYLIPHPSVFHLAASAVMERGQKNNVGRPILISYCSPRLVRHSYTSARVTDFGRILAKEKMKTFGPAFEKRSHALRHALHVAMLQQNAVKVCVLDRLSFSLQKAFTLMSQSVFCLQPPGDAPTRRAFYDSIILGCIPVIFSRSAYQFYHVNVRHIAVVIPDMENVTKRISHAQYLSYAKNAVDNLSNIPKSVIASLQANITEMQRSMQYSLFQDNYDAFGVVTVLLGHLGSI